jgi:hypothetical protein
LHLYSNTNFVFFIITSSSCPDGIHNKHGFHFVKLGSARNTAARGCQGLPLDSKSTHEHSVYSCNCFNEDGLHQEITQCKISPSFFRTSEVPKSIKVWDSCAL